MTTLQLELDALARLSTNLRSLASAVSANASTAAFLGPATGATAAATGDVYAMLSGGGSQSPLDAACRAVSTDTLPALQNVFSDRLTTVGDLIDVARTQFAQASSDRVAVITSAGSLLPEQGT